MSEGRRRGANKPGVSLGRPPAGVDIRVIAGVICATALLGSLAILCYVVGDNTRTVALNYSVLLFGIALGWVGGILVTPYDPEQGEHFSRLVTAASALITGFGLAKVDALLTKIFHPDFLLDPVVGFRAVAFVTAALAMVVAASAVRWHANQAAPGPPGGNGPRESGDHGAD